jgi:hypothetical protein
MTHEKDAGFDYNEEKAKAFIYAIASNADMLEQTAANLRGVLERLSSGAQQRAFGLQIVRSEERGVFRLLKNDAEVNVMDNSGRTSRDWDDVRRMAKTMSAEIANNVFDALESAGKLAHVVHLDHRHLGSHEVDQLTKLPEMLSKAQALLETYVKETVATPGNKESLVQAKRDAKFLSKLAAELGDTGQQVATYNEKLIDRQSELLTEKDIAADKKAKHAMGVWLLGESQDLATVANPSFRERINKRKPLDLLDEPPTKTTPIR